MFDQLFANDFFRAAGASQLSQSSRSLLLIFLFFGARVNHRALIHSCQDCLLDFVQVRRTTPQQVQCSA